MVTANTQWLVARVFKCLVSVVSRHVPLHVVKTSYFVVVLSYLVVSRSVYDEGSRITEPLHVYELSVKVQNHETSLFKILYSSMTPRYKINI